MNTVEMSLENLLERLSILENQVSQSEEEKRSNFKTLWNQLCELQARVEELSRSISVGG